MSAPLTEREAFEAWYESNRLPYPDRYARRPPKNGPEDYWDHGVEKSWRAYQAGRASALQPPVGGVQDSPNAHLAATPSEGCASDWRPIETAPKDGNYVLLFDGDTRQVLRGQWLSLDLAWDDGDGGPLEPTHWMPLPAAPTDSASSPVAPQPEATSTEASAQQMGEAVARWTGGEYTAHRTDTGEPEQWVKTSVKRLGHAVLAQRAAQAPTAVQASRDSLEAIAFESTNNVPHLELLKYWWRKGFDTALATAAVQGDASSVPSDDMVSHAKAMVTAGYFDAKDISEDDIRRIWITMDAARVSAPAAPGPAASSAVPASSPVAAFDVRFLAARVRRVMRAAGIPTTEIDKDDEFVASVAGTLLGQVAGRLENAAAASTALAPEQSHGYPVLYYMRDDHTFRLLPNDVNAAITVLRVEFDAGYTCGMLCEKSKAMGTVHAHGKEKWAEFAALARTWLANALTQGASSHE